MNKIHTFGSSKTAVLLWENIKDKKNVRELVARNIERFNFTLNAILAFRAKSQREYLLKLIYNDFKSKNYGEYDSLVKNVLHEKYKLYLKVLVLSRKELEKAFRFKGFGVPRFY